MQRLILIDTDAIAGPMAMERVLLSMSPEMKAALEKEALRRKLPGIQDLIRIILSDHLTGNR
jgi:hypothetical protein